MKNIIGFSIITLFIATAISFIIFGVTKNNSKLNNSEKILLIFTYHTLGECNEKLGAYGEVANFDIAAEDITVENLSDCLTRLNKHESVTIPIPLRKIGE